MYMHLFVNSCVCVLVSAWVGAHACVHVHIPVCVRVSAYACLRACMHVLCMCVLRVKQQHTVFGNGKLWICGHDRAAGIIIVTYLTLIQCVTCNKPIKRGKGVESFPESLSTQ